MNKLVDNRIKVTKEIFKVPKEERICMYLIG